MTEEEAKNYPCIRPSGVTLLENGLCIGSRCGMAWKFSKETYSDSIIETRSQKESPRLPIGKGWKYTPPSGEEKEGKWTKHEMIKHGYCAFAGPSNDDR